MTSIILKVRDLIDDNLQSTKTADTFEYLTSKVFTLTEANISASTIKVYKNGTLWAATNYTFDSSTNKLTITGTITAGDIIEVTYSYYAKYSDSEISGYIRAALTYISVENYKDFTDRCGLIFPTPTLHEEYLIALIASILIKGSIRSYRTPEISITFGDNLSIEDKIKKSIRQFAKTFGILEYINLELEEADPDEE